MVQPLLGELIRGTQREALRFGERVMSYRELAGVVGGLVGRVLDGVRPGGRVAVGRRRRSRRASRW